MYMYLSVRGPGDASLVNVSYLRLYYIPECMSVLFVIGVYVRDWIMTIDL